MGRREKTLTKISKETIKKMRNCKEKKLSIIEGASHLFEEEGTIQSVAEVATQWVTRHFSLGVNINRIGK